MVQVGAETELLSAGDAALAPAGVIHSIRNPGSHRLVVMAVGQATSRIPRPVGRHILQIANGAMTDLPALSETTKRKLELQWDTILDSQKLMEEEVSGYDKERRCLLGMPANPPSYIRPLPPHAAARDVGLTQSVRAAEAPFRGID